MTGDGRNDVVASYGGNSPTGRLGGLRAVAGRARSIAPPISYQSYDIPGAVEVSDVDRDGRPDAVVVHEGWLRVGLYRGQAGGQLAGEDLYPVPHSNGGNPHGLAVGDVTGDGWPDIVIADDLHGLVILPNVGEAAPPSPTPTPTRRASHSHRPRSRRRHPRRRHPAPTPTPTPKPTPTPTPAPVPPSAPQSLAASPNLAAGVGLTWQPPATQGTFPVTGYRIYRGTGGATPTPLVTVGNVLALHRRVGRERDDVPLPRLGDQRRRRGGAVRRGVRRARDRADRASQPDGDHHQVRASR